jgi:hypothetical protein
VEAVNRIARHHYTDILAVLALAATVVVFFWKIALTNRILVGLDLFAYFYPYRDYVSDALRAGQLPLWNPYLFMGAPLLANSQAAVLYPLHWPLIWLSAPKQVAWSIVIHIWLASAGAYLLGRRAMRLDPLAALCAALLFGLGGFLSAQVEHINQLNASAWLPWLLLCLEATVSPKKTPWRSLLLGAAIVALLLLAGHTQSAYIALCAAAIYALARGLGQRRKRQPETPRWWLPLTTLGLLTIAGALMAAGQLLPTLELSRLSVRSGGLPYHEAASFSLKPALFFKAFLPPLLWDPPFSEYVAYLGVLGLLSAAYGAALTLHRKPALPTPALSRSLQPARAMLAMALLGIFLALGAYNPAYYLLYKLVPGFDLFRAPARWLLLYSLGAAMLAGVGLQAIKGMARWKRVLVLLLLVELFVASRKLAYNDPTSPIAFDSLRTAPAPAGQPFRRALSLSKPVRHPLRSGRPG